MKKPELDDSLPKIGNPARSALEVIGITRLSQVTQLSKAELARLHGVGPKAIGILENALAARGLAFSQKKKP
ncbi:DNA-binding protein [Hyalangium rubrum]|uniref:DNA-binding protein n=1 Tax=Hyalangium rubrum TaxID=3103134 RepID=A0ABU5HAF0_9BACT|nr:DNA-binding protein [Hyalangium sp. s54d21]MDY7230092.1 DNA-binding protein [Hyalangium sp. s54d21]